MTLIEQIATYLDDDLNLGTLGTDIFVGYAPDSESTPAGIISVLDTGGTEPSSYLPTFMPTFQVFIRDVDYDTGRVVLDIVRNGLHQFEGTLVVGQTYFYYILAISEGGHLGRDEAGRDLFSINFRCKTR
jgi:hypothetical protein